MPSPPAPLPLRRARGALRLVVPPRSLGGREVFLLPSPPAPLPLRRARGALRLVVPPRSLGGRGG
ncbi:hypothetical protein Hgul01_02013 [Herpetosiphon gulosus]|uniref:Uncharacterized protein n=1 Tax=Herpetosiphon gulosus TaxID=1973496 RepID=A0ABP9X0A2_9CHLR